LKENYETNDNDNITPINNSRLQKYQRQGIPTQEEKGVLKKEGIVFFRHISSRNISGPGYGSPLHGEL
jgi:hypothetical protein